MPEEPPAALPKPVVPAAPNAGAIDGKRTDRPRVTFQELTERVDGSEASLDNALEALLKSGPPLDFSPPPPATPPPFFIPSPDEEQAPVSFTVGHSGGEDTEKDVLSPNLAEIMGINSLADLTDNAINAVPKTVPQAPLKPQVPPPPAQDVIPGLPDDKPKGSALDDDNGFLKMFPGAGG
jgi:hypothetical protein